jgi:hypothetical protein
MGGAAAQDRRALVVVLAVRERAGTPAVVLMGVEVLAEPETVAAGAA